MNQLTEQEEKFLDYLFDGTEVRHPDEAKVLAGYPQDYPYLKIIRKCNEALLQRYDDYLATFAPKGLAGLMDVVENPHIPGSAVKLKAIVELLNRAGVVTKERKETQGAGPSYVFLLPPKQNIKED